MGVNFDPRTWCHVLGSREDGDGDEAEKWVERPGKPLARLTRVLGCCAEVLRRPGGWAPHHGGKCGGGGSGQALLEALLRLQVMPR